MAQRCRRNRSSAANGVPAALPRHYAFGETGLPGSPQAAKSFAADGVELRASRFLRLRPMLPCARLRLFVDAVVLDAIVDSLLLRAASAGDSKKEGNLSTRQLFVKPLAVVFSQVGGCGAATSPVRASPTSDQQGGDSGHVRPYFGVSCPRQAPPKVIHSPFILSA